ncbi:hypothetical protein [Streptomyces purpureus]|uniref:DUF8175 domain-containing protein n=1 Tax=Streptomyces purpureus TaxID=1951 RepID=A0A918HEG5_9ACTN|nr:hypothetical protein [Streptomyces purpureus]GGT55525.1 hypothetical protein GCM10014713_56720 [Streptomyces purpureus]
MSLGNENDGFDGMGGTGQTRTRLPDTADPYAPPRRPARTSRSLITVVGVVVLLIAAIAFANRGDDGKDDSADTPSASTTAASGTKPVAGKNGGIASGFARDEQGAQSAAANYAVALGSDGMFKRVSRHQIVDTIYAAETAARLKGPQDAAYSADFLKKLGLDADGNPPKGSTFVSRTIPVGTKVDSFGGDTARVSVWYTGLIGMSGPNSTDPVSTAWKTWTFDLRWVDKGWRVTADSQKNGPAPVPGDIAASSSDEISKAVEEFGGFTYAR